MSHHRPPHHDPAGLALLDEQQAMAADINNDVTCNNP